MRAPARRPDGGFTLAELLLAIVILGLIMTALVTGFFVAFKTQADTTQRLDASQDARLVTATFSADVAGGNSFTTGAGPKCGTGPGSNVVLEILGGTFSPTAIPTAPPTAPATPTPSPWVTPSVWPKAAVVAYVKATVTGSAGVQYVELRRRVCSSSPQATPDSETVVARQLSATTPPAIECLKADGSSLGNGCASVNAVGVRLTLTSAGNPAATTTLLGRRRTS